MCCVCYDAHALLQGGNRQIEPPFYDSQHFLQACKSLVGNEVLDYVCKKVDECAFN